MNEPNNLLIVRTDRIGDVVLTLPIAEIVKKHFPGCKVSFLLKEYTAPLAYKNPFIDDVIILKQKNNSPDITKNVKKLKSFSFDTCIVVSPTFEIASIIQLAGIKTRIGTGYRWYSFLFNKKIYEHRKTAERHELEYNVNLLKLLGINEKVAPGQVKFNLSINPASKGEVEKIFKQNEIDTTKKIIIIHPGSGGSAMDLPVEKFIMLVEKLNQLNAQIIITGTKKEKSICEKLVINKNVKNLAGEFDLSELIALIGKSSILIANSTGPLHIAAALEKWVIGFYPKIVSCSSQRWGPYTEKKIIFTPPIDCSDCNKKQCEKLNCMNTIDINNVFIKAEKIYKLLEKNGEINASKI
jgi:lipopolysaccharide heptosyltransferase II